MYREFISRNMGNTHLRGYEYLIRACELKKEGYPTFGIYEKIAEELGTKTTAVERDIRNYISHMKKDGTYEVLKVKLNSFKNQEVMSAIVITVDEHYTPLERVAKKLKQEKERADDKYYKCTDPIQEAWAAGERAGLSLAIDIVKEG